MRDASHSRPQRSSPRFAAEPPTDPDDLRSHVQELVIYVADCFAQWYPCGITRFVPPSTAQLDQLVDRVVAEHLADRDCEVPRA